MIRASSLRPAVTAAVVLASSLAGGLAGCARWQPAPAAGPDLRIEASSFTGRTLLRPSFDDATAARLRAQLDSAADTLRRRPNDADALIWVGRRLAYLGRYREAIDTFTAGVSRFPRDARFLRHRGHRYLTIRRPMLAIQDFTKAASLVRGQPDAIEPDGAPNAQGIPLSTLQFNIWYHLGLAHYLQGDWRAALAAYDECAKVSTNPDLAVATAYWRHLTLRRLGRDADAAAVLAIARENPPLIENGAYLRVLRLFAGLEPVAAFESAVNGSAITDVTAAYGVSMWHHFNGNADEARRIWRRLDASPAWGAFGVVAAEMELARQR
jgi:tetratricopeptide (TPR) repeat protein